MRFTTNDAYLEPARGRGNLTIVGGALVDHVEFDRARAIAVRIVREGGAQTIEGGTIVLSAGAIHSPAILMRSGIGGAAQLRALGIKPLVDLPAVGENLCDHPLVQITLELKPGARSSPARTLAYNCGLRTGSGLPDAKDDLSMFAANYRESVAEGALAVERMQPLSRGKLRLRSIDPAVQPWIEFRMLSEERDRTAMRDGVRRALRLARHRAFSNVSASASAPGLTDEILADDRALDHWLRANCEEYFHAVGTCRMGPHGDPRSVVDPECRAAGVENLLICDASIVPGPPRAPTHLTAVMIAEHVAERIREKTWRHGQAG